MSIIRRVNRITTIIIHPMSQSIITIRQAARSTTIIILHLRVQAARLAADLRALHRAVRIRIQAVRLITDLRALHRTARIHAQAAPQSLRKIKNLYKGGTIV